jgi:outer membrane lipoprotein SlyB
MKTTLPLVLLIGVLAVSFAGCTIPSSRRMVRSSQANVMQRVNTGVVTSVREVNIEGTRGQIGMYGGGLVGGAAASGVGRGTGQALATAGGAVVGAIAGQALEEVATRKRAQEISIRLDDGSSVVVTQEVSGGLFADGDRVRILNGGGEARVTMATE